MSIYNGFTVLKINSYSLRFHYKDLNHNFLKIKVHFQSIFIKNNVNTVIFILYLFNDVFFVLGKSSMEQQYVLIRYQLLN